MTANWDVSWQDLMFALTIHSMRLLTILSGGRGHQAGLSMGRWGDHPRTALDHWTEHVLGLKHVKLT